MQIRPHADEHTTAKRKRVIRTAVRCFGMANVHRNAVIRRHAEGCRQRTERISLLVHRTAHNNINMQIDILQLLHRLYN